MSDRLRNRAKRLIDSHPKAIEETRHWLENPEAGDEKSAREIHVREKKLTYIVNYLQEQGDCPDSLRDGLTEVREQNKRFQRDFTGDYQDLLSQELSDLVEQYPTVVCYAFELHPLNNEVDHDFETRDHIEFLLTTLPDGRISAETVNKINVLDEVLRCKCDMHEDAYEEIQDFVARPHYPPRFWWRHPEQVFSEN